jgi:hypothetical protein
VSAHIQVTIQRDKNVILAATVRGPFGQTTLSRRELEELLHALHPEFDLRRAEDPELAGSKQKPSLPTGLKEAPAQS